MSQALTASQYDLALAGPTGSLESYIQMVNAVPVLDKAEEQRLARRLTEDADLDAARQLVASQLRFVVHIARGYSGYGLPLADLIQEGNIGLMKAVKRFDPDVGVRLVSFAVHWIKAEIHEFVIKNWKLVKVATTKAQRKLFFNLRKAKRNFGWLTKDETAAIANDLSVSEREVTEMEQRLYSHDVAFDPTPNEDEDKASDALVVALEKLDDRSREILQSRWLTEDKITLHDLADKFGVSAERIRQIENNAIKKLRSAMVPA